MGRRRRVRSREHHRVERFVGEGNHVVTVQTRRAVLDGVRVVRRFPGPPPWVARRIVELHSSQAAVQQRRQ